MSPEHSPQPDNTAVRTALWRALHVLADPPPHVFEDEVGLKLAAPGEGWRERPDMSAFTRPFRASILARARFIEDLDDMWNGLDFPAIPAGGMLESTWPHIDLLEKEKEFILNVEVPGVEEKDIDIRFADQCVILRAQRNEEHDEKETDYRYSERNYGRFERRIPLSVDIDADKARAVLRNGILTVTLPKAAQVETTGHRIPISKAA